MGKFIENIAKLIKVKTIVTFAVVSVFVILAINGTVSTENVQENVLMIIAFYFGTQHEKKDGGKSGNNA